MLLVTDRDPDAIVTEAIEPLLRKNETVLVSSVPCHDGSHQVTVDLKLHKAVYHPSDWVNEAVETALLGSESVSEWSYESIKIEDA